MKFKKNVMLIIGLILSLCGCQFEREVNDFIESGSNATGEATVESTEEEAITVPILRLDYKEEQFKEYDYGEALAQLIYGMTEEEAMIYQFDEMNPGKRETKTWHYTERQNYFYFGTSEYNKANCYGSMLQSEAVSAWELRRLWPEEEIDTCTKEEAIAACAPYASALGLENDAVTIETYGITLDYFNNDYWVWTGAPSESFEYYTWWERQAKKEEGLEEEATQMWLSNMQGNTIEDCPWQKEHEAILVVYRMHVDGIEINSGRQEVRMVYVPYYDEVVCAQGRMPFGKKEVIEEVTLILKSEAIKIAFHEMGSGITIEDVTLVYDLEDEDEFDGKTELKAIPMWRVDYIFGGRNGSIWMNAVDGIVKPMGFHRIGK